MYNPTNAELVRTNTLTKGAIVTIDATPFRQFYATKYNQILGQKKGKGANPADQAIVDRTKSKHLQRKLDGRKAASKVDSGINDQAATGRVLARISSRPGQSGRGDGYILEGKELEFYQRKIAKK